MRARYATWVALLWITACSKADRAPPERVAQSPAATGAASIADHREAPPEPTPAGKMGRVEYRDGKGDELRAKDKAKATSNGGAGLFAQDELEGDDRPANGPQGTDAVPRPPATVTVDGQEATKFVPIAPGYLNLRTTPATTDVEVDQTERVQKEDEGKNEEQKARRPSGGLDEDAPEDGAHEGRKSGEGGEVADRKAGGQLDEGEEAGRSGGRFDLGNDAWRTEKPAAFLPHLAYFENTYLGGDAAYAARLRRLEAALPAGQRPYLDAALAPQPFDAPEDAGLGLSAQLDTSHFERPGRVFLQIGLQGSRRYGWRRPPLDVVLVADAEPDRVDATLTALLRRLGPQDRLGLVIRGRAEALAPQPIADLRRALAARLDALHHAPDDGAALDGALRRGGDLLRAAADEQARVPGTQIVLLLAGGADESRVAAVAAAASDLTVQGAVTSVLATDSVDAWWPVASAGHGNERLVTDPDAAIEAELADVSRVVARLIRVNVRLAPGVEAVRVVGSRLLGQREVAEVKAREVATDRNLSRTLGVKADRGDDDDGLQTVIPYFYGGDAHVVLIELWVEKPGPVADVSLRYKDMVALTNATARASVAMSAIPRGETPLERAVRENRRGFELADALGAAADDARAGRLPDALAALEAARPFAGAPDDARLLAGFAQLLRQSADPALLADALDVARARRLGQPR
jgi:hypothetical protein